jgi:hypothetical protein
LLSKLIKEITSSKKWAHIKNIHIKTSKIVWFSVNKHTDLD